MKLIFAGSGAFGIPTLNALQPAGHELVSVYTQPDRPAGRGRKLTPTPIAEASSALGIEAVRTADLNTEALPAADVLIVIAFGQKIADPVVNHPRLGSVNLHASLLPKYRGAAPIHWAILRGERYTGNSIIRLAQRMDAGTILAQSQLEIGEFETTGELHDRLAQDGAELMLRTLTAMEAGNAIERQQDEAQATSAPKLNRQASRLDFQKDAIDLARQIRGMYPWPGCRVQIIDPAGAAIGRMTLVRARPNAATGGEPGVVGGQGAIYAGDGGLELLEVQPESKRPMSMDDFERGYQWHAGLRIEPLQ